jgi:N-acetyl-beta-hexosaminidase
MLLPQPKKTAAKKGAFDFSKSGTAIVVAHQSEGARFAAEKLKGAVCRVAGREIPIVARHHDTANSVVLDAPSQESGSEYYELDIGSDLVTVKGKGPAGLFRGAATLGQLLAAQGPRVKCCTIADAPDFAHRGFLHDVTRGKVPTLETLKLIVDKLAYYKMNQLQLYV